MEKDCQSKEKEKNVTAADEILSQLIQMAHYSGNINEKAAEKLNRVCIDGAPTDSNETTACREYPPLFSDMREQIEAIGRALASIEDVIRRVDI